MPFLCKLLKFIVLGQDKPCLFKYTCCSATLTHIFRLFAKLKRTKDDIYQRDENRNVNYFK